MKYKPRTDMLVADKATITKEEYANGLERVLACERMIGKPVTRRSRQLDELFRYGRCKHVSKYA